MRLGETMGGLLNATLGNTVELIVAILALVKVSRRGSCRGNLSSPPLVSQASCAETC